MKYIRLPFIVPKAPMQFISMNLIREFHLKSSSGNSYALTVICMLTGYTFSIPIKLKSTYNVIRAYIDDVYANFGGSVKMLSNNGTEFKNELFTTIVEQLGVGHETYAPPTIPIEMGEIKAFTHS